MLICLMEGSACALPEVGLTVASDPATMGDKPRGAESTQSSGITMSDGGEGAPATSAGEGTAVAGSPDVGGAGTDSVASGSGGMAAMTPNAGAMPVAGTMAAAGSPGRTSGAGNGAMLPDAGTVTMTPAASCGPQSTAGAAEIGDPTMLGPWATAMKEQSGPTGASTLFYPMALGQGGVLHPVFYWAGGSGTGPSQYSDQLTLLASYGFMVIANVSGTDVKPSLDWILAQNEDMSGMFFHKLDPHRVGVGGHSSGALDAFMAASDPRITLYVMACGGSGSGTDAANIHGPTILLGGDGEAGTANFKPDYATVTKAPIVFVTKTNTDHVGCSRDNLAPWVAFMRWQLCGEEKWKKEFMPDGTYCKSPWLTCMSKGFM